MKLKYFLLLLTAFCCITAQAQVSPYGQVDAADLNLTTCDFEKGANAMVLFDVAKVTYINSYTIGMQRHRRIKILTQGGVEQANVRIEYFGGGHDEMIKNVEASVYNLVNGKTERTILDKAQLVTVKVDKQRRALVFVFPNVKAGSVIEYKYVMQTPYAYNYPNWSFQQLIPTRYSEMDAGFSEEYIFNVVKKVTQPFAIDSIAPLKYGSRHIWAMKNVPAFRLEPFMHSVEDNIQTLYFKPARRINLWSVVSNEALRDEDFGLQLAKKLTAEDTIIARAKKMPTTDQKVAYLFNTVKNTVTWNKRNAWYTVRGIQKAWDDKKGNSTEINLILYRLLAASGVKSRLLLLGTRENGEIEASNASFSRINKTVVQVPIDSVSHYVLDATDKYISYKVTPSDLLNLNMLSIDPETKDYDLIRLQNNIPSVEGVFVNAEIKSSGQLEGHTQLSNSMYKRIDKLVLYEELGEKKYIDDQFNNEKKSIKIDSFNVENAKIDTVPLREDFNFKLDMEGNDGDYMYFNPNLFTGIGANPFISETRFSDIDFVYLNKYLINGRYKLPAGYKVDALPKEMTLFMPDKSISFKRVIGQMDGVIIVNYVISFGRAKYTRDEYPALREFYKKMYEMLNEQIVLKKS